LVRKELGPSFPWMHMDGGKFGSERNDFSTTGSDEEKTVSTSARGYTPQPLDSTLALYFASRSPCAFFSFHFSSMFFALLFTLIPI